MEEIIENFKAQGKNALQTGIAAGVLGIASGLCPIVGHMNGEWVMHNIIGGLGDGLGRLPLGRFLADGLNELSTMEKDKCFDALSNMLRTMSDGSKTTGEIHKTFSQGPLTHAQHMSEIHKTDENQASHSMQEMKEDWKSVEDFIHRTLQMYHEAARQLYN